MQQQQVQWVLSLGRSATIVWPMATENPVWASVAVNLYWGLPLFDKAGWPPNRLRSADRNRLPTSS